MYCTECGTALKNGAKFCHVCGKPAYTPEAVRLFETQEPDPETKKMKSAYSRAGLSTAALYGTMSAGASVAIVLIGILTAVFHALGRIATDLHGSPAQMIRELMDRVEQSGILLPGMAIYLLCAAAGTVAGIFVMRKIMRRGTPIEKRSLPFGRFLLIALICFGVWGVGALLGNLSELFGATQDSMLSTERFGWGLLPYLIYAVIGAPVLEELAFRKTLLDRLHETGEGYAAVISALLFGLMHGNHMQFFLAFFLGLVFAMVYQRTGRIVYTMLLHAMINFTATVPELFALCNIDVSLVWNIAVGALVVGGLVALLIARKHPLLHTAKCAIPDANRAVYKNAGMRVATIGGLVLIGLQGVVLIFVPLLQTENPAYLIGLIPLSLAFLTVLLLPKFTKRYEAKPEEETL